MAYLHSYPLYLHRDDGGPGKVVETAEDAHEAFGQGFKLWTPDGLVNPLDEPAAAEKPRAKKG